MVMRLSAFLLVFLCAMCPGGAAWSEDDGPTDVPDPVGLGERLALIDYLQGHGQQVVAGTDLATLRKQYRALTSPSAPSPERAARDAAALDLWKLYGVSAAPEETLAQIRTRMHQLAVKAELARLKELEHEIHDVRAADAAHQPVPPAQQATGMPAPTGKAGSDGKWTDDCGAAVASAKALGRPLLIYFTGSDWSPGCIKLEKEVFTTPKFVAWSAHKVVLMRADYPKHIEQPKDLSDQNEGLLKECNVDSFPTILVYSTTGDVIGRLGYLEGGPESWIAAAEKLPGF
jgi:hypothetical protein